MNYKVIYLKLKERYPEIAKELTAIQRPMDGYEMLRVFTLFCKIKGIQHLKIDHDKEYTRDLFIGVFIKIYDPDYLQCKKQLRADRKSTRLNSSHVRISYAVFCLKKKK